VDRADKAQLSHLDNLSQNVVARKLTCKLRTRQGDNHGGHRGRGVGEPENPGRPSVLSVFSVVQFRMQSAELCCAAQILIGSKGYRPNLNPT